jgi:hypothetical protein
VAPIRPDLVPLIEPPNLTIAAAAAARTSSYREKNAISLIDQGLGRSLSRRGSEIDMEKASYPSSEDESARVEPNPHYLGYPVGALVSI